MPEGIGYSFAPQQQANRPEQGGGRVSGVSPQQAVKLLSLRIPERAARGQIAPPGLLGGHGGAPQAPAPGLQSVIQALMQMMQGSGPGGPQIGAPPVQQSAGFGGVSKPSIGAPKAPSFTFDEGDQVAGPVLGGTTVPGPTLNQPYAATPPISATPDPQPNYGQNQDYYQALAPSLFA